MDVGASSKLPAKEDPVLWAWLENISPLRRVPISKHHIKH